MPTRIADVVTHFWSKVEKTDGCWLWLGRINAARGGYGTFDSHRVTKRAHRFAYELTYGPAPDDIEVCHRCDNPRCVRPDHLFLGTRKDNAEDCVRKGRTQRGARHHAVKLTEDQVREIRELYDSHPHKIGGPVGRTPSAFSMKALAKRFGVDPMSIHFIVSRKNWKHVA